MKKLILFFLLLTLLLGLCGCAYMDPVIRSLPVYDNEEFYTSGGFQDYTDYAKYTFDSISVQDAEASKYFQKASQEDVNEILLYIENFEQWVRTIGGELQMNYDFDKAAVLESGYFYIETKPGDGPIGQFDNYTVYYLDISAQTLYYFHNNI